MTDLEKASFGDPLTKPFWEAAAEHRLVIQRCRACGKHQFYPRPFCLSCYSDEVTWVQAAGTGTVYSTTTFRMQFSPGFPVPYVIALVQLDEGPRLMTNIVNSPCQIGDRVQVTWQERTDAPPLPVFEQMKEG